MSWLAPTFASLFSFGLWGLFTKMAIHHIDSKSALVFQTAGVLMVGILTFGLLHFKVETDIKGSGFAILTGIAYGVGCLFYFMAADKGKMMTVVTLTALYPFVTILLSFLFLNEGINFKQFLGILFAFIAIYLLSQ
jgi:bacterial/archaeal transporter family protein